MASFNGDDPAGLLSLMFNEILRGSHGDCISVNDPQQKNFLHEYFIASLKSNPLILSMSIEGTHGR